MPVSARGVRRLVICAAFLPLLSSCSNGTAAKGTGKSDAVLAVQVEPVREESVRRTIEVVGTLAAADQVTISSEAEGRVSRIAADLGDRVSAGQVLLELDREKPQYNLEQQRASLARSLARYGATDPNSMPPIEQTPDVQKAKAELEQAQKAYDRAKELNRRQLVSTQTLEDALAAQQTKQASYDAALQNAKNLSADIDASGAALKMAERQVRDTAIRAPFDGYVEKRLVNLGEYVRVQTPVMGVVRIDPLKVTAEIPEKMGPWIQDGQAVELIVDAFPDRPFAGKVSRISPVVNTSTRAFPFEALVPNPEATLKPGTFARVRIVTAKVDQVLTLSYSSLQYRYGVNRVFVVDKDHLSMRELKVGERVGERIEVLEGVKPGETVATTGVDKLEDGLKVKVSTNGNE
ncbi:MAG TPA: efflux RND transporter periplasmic adaptor subunit [Vicinamibacterales bacterium]|nr:efflux RND transporter periplasmic adaptor subunit [Vicinamibacterales bacterium]